MGLPSYSPGKVALNSYLDFKLKTLNSYFHKLLSSVNQKNSSTFLVRLPLSFLGTTAQGSYPEMCSWLDGEEQKLKNISKHSFFAWIATSIPNFNKGSIYPLAVLTKHLVTFLKKLSQLALPVGW